jgi:hypothetical protein
MTKSQRWIVKHFGELVERYGGKYISVVDEKIVTIGASPVEVDRKAREQFPDKIPSVIHVPTKEALTCIL